MSDEFTGFFTTTEKKEFKEAFAIYDEDGDGKINSETCCRAMRACGSALTQQDVANITTDLDLYSDGEVNFDAFLALMEQYKKPMPTAKELEEAFKKLDADKSGKISAKEFKHYLKNVGEVLTDDEIQEMIKDIDQDGDGEIDYKEFATLMTRTSSYKDF